MTTLVDREQAIAWLHAQATSLESMIAEFIPPTQAKYVEASGAHATLRLIRQLDLRIEALEAVTTMWLDWHNLDTQAWVAKYGAGMTSRDLGDKFRAALRVNEEEL